MTGKVLLTLCGTVLLLLPNISFAQRAGIHSTTLSTGLQVFVVENPIVPLVTVALTVRNGAFVETPEFNGLSHLYEHLFFSANASFPSHEICLERARELGMTLGPSLGGRTREEHTYYWFTLPKENLDPGLEFISAAVTTALFLDEDLKRERQVIINEFDRGLSYPNLNLRFAVNKALWSTHYSRKNSPGDREVILTADQKKMKTIKARYYLPNNAALFIGGDVEHERAFSLAEQHFGKWQKGEDPFALYPVPEHPPLAATETVVVERPVTVVTLWLSWHGPSLSKDPAGALAADVLSYLLAQRNSRFQNRLVASGLCSWVWPWYQTLNHTGLIRVEAEMKADNYRQAERVLLEELQQLAETEYYTDDQLAMAKDLLLSDMQYYQESPSLRIHTLAEWWALDGSLEYYHDYESNVRKVTRRDISAFVRKYIQTAHFIKGVLVSPDDRKQLFPQ